MKWNFKLTCLAILATPVWSAASRVVSADTSLKEAPSESSVLEGLGQAHPWQQRTVRRTRALCDPASLSWPLLTSLPQTLLLERAFSHGRRLLKGTCYSPCVSTQSTSDPPNPKHTHIFTCQSFSFVSNLSSTLLSQWATPTSNVLDVATSPVTSPHPNITLLSALCNPWDFAFLYEIIKS